MSIHRGCDERCKRLYRFSEDLRLTARIRMSCVVSDVLEIKRHSQKAHSHVIVNYLGRVTRSRHCQLGNEAVLGARLNISTSRSGICETFNAINRRYVIKPSSVSLQIVQQPKKAISVLLKIFAKSSYFNSEETAKSPQEDFVKPSPDLSKTLQRPGSSSGAEELRRGRH